MVLESSRSNSNLTPIFSSAAKATTARWPILNTGLRREKVLLSLPGDVGAGKTTLVRNLFRKLESGKVLAAQIVNTHLDSEDTLRLVAAAFGLPYENLSKASLLIGLEQFFRKCDQEGKRALLVVDEAQNLSPRTVEELRMLSNFQTEDKPLLQTFLLGQPEFRKTLLSGDMQQLRQRVTATYHLGPMDLPETRSYIEHRLTTAGWRGDPSFDEAAFEAIYAYAFGIPRSINAVCDRLLLMGCLEQLHHFGEAEVGEVISDIQQEFEAPISANLGSTDFTASERQADEAFRQLKNMDERLAVLEDSVFSTLELIKEVVSLAGFKHSGKDKS